MKTALITGATSGIGYEFAKRYANSGYRIIIVGRRKERMLALKNKVTVPCKMIEADLSIESECKRLLDIVKDVKIDIFINNAGFGDCGEFLQTNIDKEISMIHVNDIAMHILFKGILQKMEKQNAGLILNVASSAGLMPAGPYMSTYYATKAYMVSLTKGVAAELRDRKSKVKVFALCPGPVDTEFNFVANAKFSLPGISINTCVDAAMKGMKGKDVIIVPTIVMKLAVLGQKLLPDFILLPTVSRQQQRKLYQKH